MSGALVKAVLVRAAEGRLHVGMGGDAREDTRQAVEALLVLLGVDLGHGESGHIRVEPIVPLTQAI